MLSVGFILWILVLQLLFFVTCATSFDATYLQRCDSAFCRILERKARDISNMKKTVVEEGTCIPHFGQKADQLCHQAIEEFSTEAALPDDYTSDHEALYDQKVEDLERLIDAPLHVLYLQQLAIVKERALKLFKTSLASSAEGATEFEAMLQADELFKKEAEDFTRQSVDWSYARDAALLKQAFLEIASKQRKIADVKQQAAKQNQQAMSYLQMQQQQLQAIQQQVSGQSSPWNVAAAYRVPDTNINLSVQYQQGRANVQLSCVPDEAYPLLGPNGFVHGVTPGNIGLSFNINV